MKNLPKRIYLQIDPDINDFKEYRKTPNGADITWCEDEIDKTDVEYVRAVLLEKLKKEIKEISETGYLPDGDMVNLPTKLWAEGWIKKL